MIQEDQRKAELLSWINNQPEFQSTTLDVVSGDASFRRYFRFKQKNQSYIAVDAPPELEDSHQFVYVSQSYLQKGIPVPAVVKVNYELGFYCQDDFGDAQFADQLNADTCRALYLSALSHLPAIQSCTETEHGVLPPFDEALLAKEFHLFSHWLLEKHLNLSLDAEEKALLNDTFALLQRHFLNQPQVGVHRDYHSRNLMIRADNSIGIIDFQDAVIGPITYDAVSLLRDCYQVWPDELVVSILKEFHQRYHSQYDWVQYKTWFDMTGMQRHIKASGIFARLCYRDGKAAYLADIPRTLDYLINVGSQYSDLKGFAALVKNKIKPAAQKAID